MAFGFTPKFNQDFQLENLEKEQFLVVAHETAAKLNWETGFVSETGLICYTKSSFSSWSEEVTIKIKEDGASIKSECTGSQLFDWGKNKKNVEEFLAQFNEVKNSLTPEEIEIRIGELRQNYPSKENDILNQPPSTSRQKITGFFSIFTPTKGYFITPLLVDLNIILFLMMIISGVNILLPDNDSLLNWGANFRPVTLDGQMWRLLTACFLHIGIIHLLMNMYALVYIGLLLEPYLGKARFLSAYLLTGISSSLVSLSWNSLTISAGASGAIFGMYGIFLALLTTNVLSKSVKKAFLTSILVFVGYNLLNGLKAGIDSAAHIGGLVTGLVTGYAFIPGLKQFNSVKIKTTTILVLSILVVSSCYFVTKKLPNDIGKYTAEIQKFANMEAMALEVYSLPPSTPNEKILDEIQNRGIYYWNESIKLIDSFDKLDLPAEIIWRNAKLREYCELRINSYNLLIKSIQENTDIYADEINEITTKINEIINELQKGK